MQGRLLIVLACSLWLGALGWTELEEVEVLEEPTRVKGVEKAVKEVMDSVSLRSQTKSKTKIPASMKTQMKIFKAVFEGTNFDVLSVSSRADSNKLYEALTGKSPEGVAVLAYRSLNQETASTETLIAYGLTAATFGNMLKKYIFVNPFEGIVILKSIKLAGWAAATTSGGAVQLPRPVKTAVPNVLSAQDEYDPGLCFSGRVKAPEDGCQGEVVCTLVSKALANPNYKVFASGCLQTDKSISLLIDIRDIKLGKAVELKSAGLQYAYSPKEGVQFGARAELNVKFGSSKVLFVGELYLKQTAALTLLGLKFAMSGLVKGAFGVSRLNFGDLVLEGELGVAAGALPVVNRLVIGGTLCLGDGDDCEDLTSRESLLQLPHGHVMELATKTQAAIAMKLYIGFDADSGGAFFYSAMSRTSIASLIGAFAGKSLKLPDWMAKIKISGYDEEACNEGKKAACYAYVSYAATGQSIDSLSPPLNIPPGMNTRGRIELFGKSLGFGLTISPARFRLELDGPSLSLAGGAVQLRRSKEDATSGPHMLMKGGFQDPEFYLRLQGFAKLGPVGEAQVSVLVDNNQQHFNFTHMKLFAGVLQGEVKLQVNIKKPTEMRLEVAVDLRKVSSLLNKLTKAAKAPLDKLKKYVEMAIKKVDQALGQAEAGLVKAEKGCKKATSALSAQKRKCQFLIQQEAKQRRLIEQLENSWSEELVEAQLFGRRRRRWFKSIKKFATKTFNKAKELKDKAWAKAKELKRKAVEKAKMLAAKVKAKAIEVANKAKILKEKALLKLKEAAKNVCKKALGTVVAVAKGACDVGLSKATWVLKKARSVAGKVGATARRALEVAMDAVAFLTTFRLNEIRFIASGLESLVKISISMEMKGKPKVYEFEYDFKGSSPLKMAKALFSKIFKELKKKAVAMMKKIISLDQDLIAFAETREEPAGGYLTLITDPPAPKPVGAPLVMIDGSHI